MTTLAHTHCPVCNADVMAAIGIEHETGPGVNCLAPVLHETAIDDMQCCHALEMDAWLESDAGRLWQSEAIEKYEPTREV